jgi:hypothetical protein
MMVATFQSTVNVSNALGLVGELAFDGPIRAGSYNLYSAGTPNVIGYAFTVTNGISPDPAAAAGNAGTAQVGGTGVFAGILQNPKEHALLGTTGSPLGPVLTLPDYETGALLMMGEIFVNLPGPALVGNIVTYDPLTGALNSMPPITKFTGSIAAGGSAGVADVLTVTAVSAGRLGVGQIISGVGVEPATIISLGTGVGYTGTYNISTINQQTVSSVAMTTDRNLPDPAFVITTGSIATSGGVDTLTVTTLASGQIAIGSQIFGTGVAANTVVTAFGSGVGGTGTYTLNTSGQSLSGRAMSGPANLVVPNCVVTRYDANTLGGVAAIKLTN